MRTPTADLRDRARATGSPESVRAPRALLWVLFLGVLMGALDIAIVGPALPAIQRAFGVAERDLAWAFTVYVLLHLVGTPLMAKLADRFGRRAIYVLDVGLFALGSLIVAAAPGFGGLLLGRALQGFGSGGIFPVASAVIGDVFPPERRGRALGLLGAVFGLAFLIGPVLGGLLLRYSWRWLFLINLPVAAWVIALALRLLPSGAAHPHPEQKPFDWAGWLTLGGLLIALDYGLDRLGPTTAPTPELPISAGLALLVAVGLFPLFVRAERRSADPILRLELLWGSGQARRATLLALGAGLFEGALVFVPAMLVAAYEISSATASFLLLPAVVAMALGAPTAGFLLDRWGSRAVVLWGTALLAVGLALLGLLASRSLGFFYLSSVLVGFGLTSLLGAPLRYILLHEAPPSERSVAQGAIGLVTTVGLSLSGPLMGGLIGTVGGVRGYTVAYGALALVALALMGVAWGLKGRGEERASLAQADTEANAKDR